MQGFVDRLVSIATRCKFSLLDRGLRLTSSAVFLPLFLRTCKGASTTEASLFAFIGAAVAVPMAGATLFAVAKLKVYACPLSTAWAVYILATGALAIVPEGIVGLDIAAAVLQGAASGIIVGKKPIRLCWVDADHFRK